MKKLILIITMLTSAFTIPSKMNVSTPELFGNGIMTLQQGKHGSITGHISAWGEWEIYGTADRCFIKQVGGDAIGGAENPIPCHMNFISKKQFNGWIDFRGHPRKFCGGVKSLPHKCFGK
jgi:hypothetical protein